MSVEAMSVEAMSVEQRFGIFLKQSHFGLFHKKIRLLTKV